MCMYVCMYVSALEHLAVPSGLAVTWTRQYIELRQPCHFVHRKHVFATPNPPLPRLSPHYDAAQPSPAHPSAPSQVQTCAPRFAYFWLGRVVVTQYPIFDACDCPILNWKI